MNESKNRIALLLQKYRERTATRWEEHELYELIAAEENEATVKELFVSLLEKEDGRTEINKENWETVLRRILEHERGALVVDGRNRFNWKRLAVAASVVAILFTGWWLLKDKTTDNGPQTTIVQTDVKAPDKNRASIRLADGRIVYLDSSDNGQLAVQQGVAVIKSADGVLEYNGQLSMVNGQLSMVNGQLEYNTVNNPRGSKVMQMTLSDGSKVWLNAGSAITYPVAFIGNDRKVSIQGEAYFEVAHNESKPFIVSKGEMSVQVLGTHFNVNAYDDEDGVRVTLLEGSVRVQPGAGSRESVVIKPGEQARVMSDQLSVMSNVNIEQVMAWKEGTFYFGEGMSMEEILRQVARWYDVEIVYEKRPSGKIGGSISRNVNISNVLKILSVTGSVQFEVNGKIVKVK